MKGLWGLILFSTVFWNLENFFDYFDGGYSSSDREFSSSGDRHWTKKRFQAKLDLTAKTLLWCGCPEVVGVAEIENSFVLRCLLNGEILHKMPYSFVHFESRDPRGIDVGLLYRKDRFTLDNARPLPVLCGSDTLKTRDILYVGLKDRRSGDLWHFFVNHHPSKYSGASSAPRRIAAMESLLAGMDSILLNEPDARIVAMGDFNDGPDSEAFSLIGNRNVVNAGLFLIGKEGPDCGSIRYQGHWQLIDNFLYTGNVGARMEVLHPPFLTMRDRSFPGEKPLRTYSGPRYLGGVSDHRPIRLTVSDSLSAKPRPLP